jgi:hypothetical protein
MPGQMTYTCTMAIDGAMPVADILEFKVARISACSIGFGSTDDLELCAEPRAFDLLTAMPTSNSVVHVERYCASGSQSPGRMLLTLFGIARATELAIFPQSSH